MTKQTRRNLVRELSFRISIANEVVKKFDHCLGVAVVACVIANWNHFNLALSEEQSSAEPSQ